MDPQKLLLFRTDGFNKLKQIPRSGKPELIGSFSVNYERIYTANASELKLFVESQPINFPLNVGEETLWLDDYDFYGEHLDNMMYFIRDNKESMLKCLTPHKAVVCADIVTNIDVLQTLMCTLDLRQNWRIYGIKDRGTVYLSLASPDPMSAPMVNQRLCRALDKTLKGFLYFASPDKQPYLSNADGELHGVFRLDIGGTTLVYESTMGAYCSNTPEAPKILQNSHIKKFAEFRVIPLNTSKDAESELTLRLWSECILKGCKQIYLARQTTSGCVLNLEKIPKRQLRRQNEGNWNGIVNKLFMNFALLEIINCMEFDNAKMVYQFDYDFITGSLNYEINNEGNEHNFISDWYRIIMNQYSSQLSI